MNEQLLIQQGRQIIEAALNGNQQAMQIVNIAQEAMQDEEAQSLILQEALSGKEEAQLVMSVMLAVNQAQMAKFGAKLNYIKHLRGLCPDGYEMQFFMNGGKACKTCRKKISMSDGGPAPKNAIDAFKCGRRMKKKACGGSMQKKKDKES